MLRTSCIAILMLLTGSMMFAASAQDQISSQDQVSQTVYVYDGDFNGTTLSDVQVTGQDAAGNSFEGVTDSNGVAVIGGQPGTWYFAFNKDGYNLLELNYNVTETGEGAVYLQKATQTEGQVSLTQNRVFQTVYVYDGDFNGTMLSDVQVTGQDAAGNSFEGVTDSNGVVAIGGQPGTWYFAFNKDGYNPLELNYNVTETGEGSVYLQKAN
jgi:hypothetical protein